MSTELASRTLLASILDKDGQQLAIGQARFYTDQGRGVFWPHIRPDEDLLLKNAATVQTSAGQTQYTLQIADLARGNSGAVAHYDFAFVL